MVSSDTTIMFVGFVTKKVPPIAAKTGHPFSARTRYSFRAHFGHHAHHRKIISDGKGLSATR